MTKQVTDKMINTFTQAMLLSMPEVEDHYDQVKFGLEAVFNLASGNQEVDALKAQVNRFKHGVESFNKTGSMNELLSAYIETPKQCLDEHDAKLRMQLDCALKAQVNCLREALTDAAKAPNHTFYYAKEALEATPEQCLAKVKAKAIEEYKQEQAEMKQMELATKLMVSSI